MQDFQVRQYKINKKTTLNQGTCFLVSIVTDLSNTHTNDFKHNVFPKERKYGK